MSETTNPITANLATERGALPLRRLHLIGVAGPPEARRALLRTSAGQIQTVSVGDTLRQGTVAAIDDDKVILTTRTGAETMRMPEASHPPVAA